MILAGRTYAFSLTDGRELSATLTLGDETRFERVYKGALARHVEDDSLPVWVILAVIHAHLLRTGVDIPDDVDAFADLLDEASFREVSLGKAEDSPKTPPTG